LLGKCVKVQNISECITLLYLRLSTGASGEPNTDISSEEMMSGSSIPLTSTQGVTGVLVRTDVGTYVTGVEVATLDGGLLGVVTGVDTDVVTVVNSSGIKNIHIQLYFRLIALIKGNNK